MDKVIGIYIIKNSIDSRVYIGQSINVNKRILEHTNLLYYKKHYNQHLNNFVAKHGLHIISFELLEKCSKQDLNTLEKKWICFYDSRRCGFNCTDGGEDNPMNHVENRQKVSNALRGHKKSKEWIDKLNLNKNSVKAFESKIKSGNIKYVYAYDSKTGNKLDECYGYLEMAKRFNINESNVRQCIYGILKSAQGIHYSLEVKDPNTVLTDVIKNNTKQEYKEKMSKKNMGSGNPNFGKRHPSIKRKGIRTKRKTTKYCNPIIMYLYSSGNTQKQVASIIGCTQVHVSDVFNRKPYIQ